MSSLTHFPSDIKVSTIEFGPVKLLDSGGKSVNIRYEGRNLMLETPSLSVPYGVNVFDKQGPPKFSVDLSSAVPMRTIRFADCRIFWRHLMSA